MVLLMVCDQLRALVGFPWDDRQDLASSMPAKVAKMKEIFTVEATKNKARLERRG